jgi:hypothetical protein
MDRHDRQARLAEVGAAGQDRIAAATVAIRTDGLAAQVATRYLAGAGVGVLRVRDRALVAAASAVDPQVRVEIVASEAEGPDAATADAAPPGFHDAGARDVARGAREALRALRRLLEVAS